MERCGKARNMWEVEMDIKLNELSVSLWDFWEEDL